MSLGASTGSFVPPSAEKPGYSIDGCGVDVFGQESRDPTRLIESITMEATFKGKLYEKGCARVVRGSQERRFIPHSLNPSIEIID